MPDFIHRNKQDAQLNNSFAIPHRLQKNISPKTKLVKKVSKVKKLSPKRK